MMVLSCMAEDYVHLTSFREILTCQEVHATVFRARSEFEERAPESFQNHRTL